MPHSRPQEAWVRFGWPGLLLLASTWAFTAADEPNKPLAENADTSTSAPNIPATTFGGKQFWTDEFVYLDWRIQRNVLSNHFRLLDEKNVRRAWGTYESCQEEFQRRKREALLPPLGPRVVIVLHGLVRSREAMDGLCQYLRENSDLTVLNVSYASSREKIADHAAGLARVVARLEGVQEVDFVAHSLGNLVVRHFLGDRRLAATEPAAPRIHRIVMLAPPNQGADMALRFRDNPLFKVVWGESGRELAQDWPELEKRLAVPDCPFGVIAGGKGDGKGRNPLLAGDDDFVVSVEETRLGGACDFSVVPALHGIIMDNRQVREQTLRFLQHGYFVSAETRQPIPAGHSPQAHE